MRIEVGYGFEGTLTDATSRRIIAENVAPYFREGKFAAGINAGVDRIIERRRRGQAAAARRSRRAMRATRAAASTSARCCSLLFIVVPLVGSVLRSIFGRSWRVDARRAASSAPRRGSSPDRSLIAVVAGVVGFIVMHPFAGAAPLAAGGERRVFLPGGLVEAGRRRRRWWRRRLVGRRRQLRRRRRVGRLVMSDGLATPRDAGCGTSSTDHRTARRAFPPAVMRRIEAAIAEGERHHSGQVCFAVEPSLPLGRVWKRCRRASARSRCSACCACGTPRRTAACWSTCCSPIATSRSSPTAASTPRSATRRGKRSAGRWKRRFASGRYSDGRRSGHHAHQRTAGAALPAHGRAAQRAARPPRHARDALYRLQRPARRLCACSSADQAQRIAARLVARGGAASRAPWRRRRTGRRSRSPR